MPKVTINEIQYCFDFAEKLWNRNATTHTQFGREFDRTKMKYIGDHVIGKAVEIGFNKFLTLKFNISFKVEFDIWDNPHVHDEGNDLAHIYMKGESYKFPIKTDIKGSRENSAWLLVEDHKIKMFKTKIYVLGKLTNIPKGNKFEENPYDFKNIDWDVDILGYAINKDLIDKNFEGWMEFKNGERLIKPHYLKSLRDIYQNCSVPEFKEKFEDLKLKLQPTSFMGPKLDCRLNYGIPINWLRNNEKDWSNLEKTIRKYVEKI